MNTGGVGGAGGPRGFEDFEQAGEAAPAGETQAAGFPRSGWKDQEALGRAVRTAESGVEHSRPNQRMKWVDAKRTDTSSASATRGPASLQVTTYGKGGASGAKKTGSPSAPVIAMKYGGPTRPGGTGGVKPTPAPVIAMKYGGPTRPGGTGGVKPTPAPVIAMKYGGPTRPGGGGGGTPTHPVIVMKYGGPTINPGGGGGGPTHPVIAMKYGGPTRPPRD